MRPTRRCPPRTLRATASPPRPFIAPHPVTGKAVVSAAGAGKTVAAAPLTGAIAPGKATPVDLAEAKRRLARSAAWDGIANVSAAFGFYADDVYAQGFTGVIAEKGFKMTPFAGYYITRAQNQKARISGEIRQMRPMVPYHWLMEPVILVSDDGRSAFGRFRLFQPRTAKQTDKDGYSPVAGFWGGYYNNRYVLEDGRWSLWELTLDEPFISPVPWRDGHLGQGQGPAAARSQCAQARFLRRQFPARYPADQLAPREDHFQGGTRRQLAVADDPADVVQLHQSGERGACRRSTIRTACPAPCGRASRSRKTVIRKRRASRKRTSRLDRFLVFLLSQEHCVGQARRILTSTVLKLGRPAPARMLARNTRRASRIRAR